MLKLYSYFRSSAAYRCRIALNLKGLAHETAFVHLTKDGGQHNAPAYRALNPQGLVPVLEDDGQVITQSLAIIEYLDETHPEPPLLPRNPLERARVRAFAQVIACDIHPIDNLRVLNYLKGPLGHDQAAADAWYRHWLQVGLAACEALLPGTRRNFCFGDQPTLADICLVPQIYNAAPFQVRPRGHASSRRHRRDLPRSPGIRQGRTRGAARRGMTLSSRGLSSAKPGTILYRWIKNTRSSIAPLSM